MESFLCNLIVTGAIPDAKIHRPAKVVNLRARKANIEQLDQWASSVRKLTDILNKVIVFFLWISFDNCHRSNWSGIIGKPTHVVLYFFFSVPLTLTLLVREKIEFLVLESILYCRLNLRWKLDANCVRRL